MKEEQEIRNQYKNILSDLDKMEERIDQEIKGKDVDLILMLLEQKRNLQLRRDLFSWVLNEKK